MVGYIIFVIGARIRRQHDHKKEDEELQRKRMSKKELAKAREKRQKKMIRTKYGQAPKRHARQGIKSCMYFVSAAFVLLLMVSVSLLPKGSPSYWLDLRPLWLVMAGRGLASGIRGFKERDKNYITCKVGTICCGLLILGMCAIFIRGFFQMMKLKYELAISRIREMMDEETVEEKFVLFQNGGKVYYAH